MEKETTTIEKKSSATDKKLGVQNDDILFPRKVEEAKQRIAKYGLPDIAKKKH